MDEIWLPIDGFPAYEVSSMGKVRSIDRKIRTRGGGFAPRLGAPIAQKPSKKGYLEVCLCMDGKQYTRRAHRLVAIAFVPRSNPTLQVNHIDGCKTNNAASNLEWVTAKENIRHGWESRLMYAPSGSKHGRSKLTEEDVLEIRRISAENRLSQVEIGKMFGVQASMVSRIVTRANWTHI